MIVVFIMIAAIMALLFLFLFLLAMPEKKPQALYEAQESLFTPAERNFMMVLQSICASHFAVFGKVRIADVIAVRKGLEPQVWRRAFNRISAKHVDYVLCDPRDLSVLCVIELDDASHRRKDRSERDTFVDAVFAEAGIPCIRIPARASYSPAEVTATIRTALDEASERERVSA